MGFAADFRFWLFYSPSKRPATDALTNTEYYLTGDSLIDKIAQAISLDQSVVLSGPRGCGKSYCADKAIERAMEQGIIPKGAKVKLQGNPEFPRDYLAEDDIAFMTMKKLHGGEMVLPYNRSAPLFRFAKRDDVYNRPEKGDDDRVVCEMTRAGGIKEPCGRFVLFLDEINRFSNGVLDSLLSVLEEREAYLAGETFRLPVVVIMTMNPPGYDASTASSLPLLRLASGATTASAPRT